MHFAILLSVVALASAVQFEIQNNVPGPISVGILGNDGRPPLANGGFVLNQGESKTVDAPEDWAGRFWARTYCDPNTNHCETGDCGNKLECAGSGGNPPVTLVEITLKGGVNKDTDFYDVSLVDGYNTKAEIQPINGQGDGCKTVACNGDVNANCPDQLRQVFDGNTIACLSSCAKFNTPQYCCGEGFGPDNCDPNTWEVNSAKHFKEQCPDAYSYAYDDKTSTFTCKASQYKITFS